MVRISLSELLAEELQFSYPALQARCDGSSGRGDVENEISGLTCEGRDQTVGGRS